MPHTLPQLQNAPNTPDYGYGRHILHQQQQLYPHDFGCVGIRDDLANSTYSCFGDDILHHLADS